eukprot:scpid87374/ scgid11611/ 
MHALQVPTPFLVSRSVTFDCKRIAQTCQSLSSNGSCGKDSDMATSNTHVTVVTSCLLWAASTAEPFITEPDCPEIQQHWHDLISELRQSCVMECQFSATSTDVR